MTDEAQVPTPVVGEPCPCCGRKVTAPKQTKEEQRDKRREYHSRPEVKERQKAYNAKRNAELRELRELKKQLDSAEVEDEPEPEE